MWNERIGAVACMVFVAGTALPAVGVAQGQPVTVRLQRPSVVGERTHVDVSGERHQMTVVTIGGRVAQQRPEERRGHLVAVERILAVNERGSATRSEFTVEQFEDRGPTPLVVHRGQVLVVERGDTSEHATVTLDGQPLTREQRHDLETVVSLTVSPITDDDVFGNPQPQAVGATWPLHGDVAARDLARMGITATLAGQTHLLRRRMDHGVDSIEVSAEMTGAVTAIAEMPPGATIRSGSLRASLHGVVPVAPVGPVHSGDTLMHMEVVMAFQANGQPAEVSVRADEAKHQTATPM